MKIMICFVLFILLLERCTSLTGRVCAGEGRKKYCCSESQNVNGVCVDCGIGFTSLIAQRCLPCKYPFFGVKCSFTCKCRNNQRCDHVVGCVDIPTTEGNTEAIQVNSNCSLFVQPWYTHALFPISFNNPPYADKKQRHDVIADAVIRVESISTLAAKVTSDIATHSDSATLQHTIQTSSIKTVLTEPSKVDTVNGNEKETKSDFSVREVIVYASAVAVVLLVMGMCYLVNKYRTILNARHLKITQQTTDSGPLNKNDDVVVMEDEDEDDEELYDEINESEVNDSVFKVPVHHAYLEIIDGPSDRDIVNNSNGYLTPIPSLSKVVPHLNDPSPKKHILHRPQINRLDSDSGSSSESIVRNEGYLNPYQPLREINTSISHRYEIPRLYGSLQNLSELRNKYQNSGHHQDVYNGEQIGTTRINQHVAPLFNNKELSNVACRNKQEVDTYYTDCLSKLVKTGRIHNIKSGSI